jgi:DNA-binding MarR family transcriptional regulator
METFGETMRPPVSGIEDHLGFWLRFVSNHVSHAFGLKVEARGVSVAEWVMMRELFERAAAPSEIAARLGMTRGAISKLTDRLVAKSLVTRTSSKEDARFQAVTLTQKGRALVPALATLADQNDEEFFGHLDVAARESLSDMMKEIVRHLRLNAKPVD